MSHVRTEVKGEIVYVVMDDGKANVLNRENCIEIAAEITAAADLGGALVLTGSGGVFTAGGDWELLRQWDAWPPPERVREVSEGPHAVSRALLESRIPTVCAINGAAVGAGVDLSLVCDLRIASTSASFSEGYVNIGVVPGDGGSWLLPRHIGLGAALDLLLTGRSIGADEALRLGLVGRVASPEDLLDTAGEMAQRLASRPRQALLAIRQMVYDASVESFQAHLTTASRMMGLHGGTEEHRAAVEAIAGRAPSIAGGHS